MGTNGLITGHCYSLLAAREVGNACKNNYLQVPIFNKPNGSYHRRYSSVGLSLPRMDILCIFLLLCAQLLFLNLHSLYPVSPCRLPGRQALARWYRLTTPWMCLIAAHVPRSCNMFTIHYACFSFSASRSRTRSH